MRSNYKKLGDYIRQVNIRNTDGKIKQLVGVNLNKKFMPSVANIIGADLTKYKVVKKGQFGCKFMSVGRDGKLPISLMREHDEAIISSAYYVFEVKDENELLSEYLMMWLSRSENDRYLWFISGADVRGSISWNDFCSIEINIPSIERQKEIVKEYHTITDRIKLNEQLNQKLEDTAQSIYKEWFVNFEFPDENGKPYKSNGGEMEYCDELDMEVPKEWNSVKLSEIAKIRAGGDKPEVVSEYKSEKLNVPIYANSTENEGLYGYTDKAKITEKSITVSARGAIIGYTVLRLVPFVPIVRLIVVTPRKKKMLSYLYESIKNFRFNNESSAQGQLTVPDISSFKILDPTAHVLEHFQCLTDQIIKNIELFKKETTKLETTRDILLSKMATID